MRPAALLFMLAAPAAAAELPPFDRTIRREPAYAGKPEYLLVVLGPNAEERIWVVRDGETVYADLDGDGDLTRATERATAKPVGGKRFADAGAHFSVSNVGGTDGLRSVSGIIRSPRDGAPAGMSVDALSVMAMNRPAPEAAPELDLYSVTTLGDGPGPNVRFGPTPADAPVAWCGGSNGLYVVRPTPLVAGERRDVTVSVGTGVPGRPGVAGTLTCRSDVGRRLPKAARAVLELDFAGGAGRQMFPLAERSGWTFRGPVAVPAGAKLGKVAGVIRFEGWPDGEVAEGSVTLDVQAPEPPPPAEPTPAVVATWPVPGETEDLRSAPALNRWVAVAGDAAIGWDAATRTEVVRVPVPAATGRESPRPAFSRDGATLFVPVGVATGGTVRVFDMATGAAREPITLPRDCTPIRTPQPSPDGATLFVEVRRAASDAASAGPTEWLAVSLPVGDARSLGERDFSLVPAADARAAFTLRPDYDGGRLRVELLRHEWPPVQVTRRAELSGDIVVRLATSADGATVAASELVDDGPRRVRLFDAKTLEPRGDFQLPPAAPKALSHALFAGGRLLVAEDAGPLTVWSVADRKIERTIPATPGRPFRLSARADGRLVAALWENAARQPRVTLVDPAGVEPPRTLPLPGGARRGRVAFGPGDALAVGGAGAVYLLDAKP